jgi:alpha-beta hydrolase superfamily lysophospholipase
MARMTDFNYPSSDGKTRVHAREWMPDTDHIAGVVQIVHGMSEHVGRYEDMAQFMTQYGYVVVGDDHLGHGLTAVTEKELGFFAEKDGWMRVTEDVRALKILSARRFPDVPYFMLGHSMGSFLARTYLIRFPGTLNGAVLSGTGWMSDKDIRRARLLTAVETRRLGLRGHSPIARKFSNDNYNKHFAPNRTDFDWLSVDTANVDRYVADPLCGFPQTIGALRDMLDGFEFNQNPANLAKMDVSTPVLFMSGASDPVGDMGEGVKRSKAAFENAGVRDVTMKLYAGARHEIFNDLCRKDALYDTLNWFESHARDGAAAVR